MLARVTAIVALFVMPNLAMADEQPLWKSVGNWDIRVDTTIANSCFAVASWEPDIWLRIGFDMEQDSFYVFVGSSEWNSLETGKEYKLVIAFGGKQPWDVVATGKTLGGPNSTVLYFSSTQTEFIDEFMRQKNMEISYRGESIANLSLKQSYVAFQEVMDCQTVMLESSGNGSGSDPFQSTESKSSDPFSN